GLHVGGDDDLDELALDDALRGLGVERAVEGNDAAEGTGRIAGISALVGFGDVVRQRDPAGIGVLDDDASWLGKGLDALQRGIGVGDVVEGQRLTLQLPSGSDAGLRRLALAVEGGALVRVLAVAQVLALDQLQRERGREWLLLAVGIK